MTALRPWRDVRGRLLIVVLSALVIALAIAIFGFNRLFTTTSERNANALVRSRAASALATIDIQRGHLRVRETKDDAEIDSRVWIFEGSHAVESPPARPDIDAAARSLIGGPARFHDVGNADTRLYAVPVYSRGTRVGTVVAAMSLAPYEQTERTALIDSLVLASVLLVVVGIAVWWLLAAALRPVVRMTEQAEVWSERELDRRFDLGPPHDELTRLGATLDRLLDRLAASLRHERRFSAELSHELRTPLARVIAEAELALRRERTPGEYRTALEDVRRNATQVSRIVDALVAAARHEVAATTGTSDAFAVASEVIDHCGPLATARNVVVEIDSPRAPLRIGVDGDLVERTSNRSWRTRAATAAVACTSVSPGPPGASSSRSTTTVPASATTNGKRSSSPEPAARRVARTAPEPVWASRSRDGSRARHPATSSRSRTRAARALRSACPRPDVQAMFRLPRRPCAGCTRP